MKKKMKRICYLGLGHLCVVLAVLGAILPVMPCVVFLIAAAWAYGNSSEKFQNKIYNHPKYGPLVREWQIYGVIPKRAKICAGVAMLGSFILCTATAHHWWVPALVGVTLACVYAYILSRPSVKPDLTTSS